MTTPQKTPAEDLKSRTSLPVIVAPMFLVSNPDMALASCKEGLVGSFPALNQLTSEGFEEWLIKMNEGIEKLKTDNPGQPIGPYAVNLIVHKTNPRLEEDLALCVKHKVPIVITSLGAVPDLVKAVHAYGGIVLHDVTNVEHAKKAAAAGVDGLIAVSAGAGGHAGTRNPVSLVNEIREFFDGIVVLAGCLSHGQDVLAAQAMGADFAYMGTRFVATKESSADPAYKQMICDATASDVIYTSAVSGIPANFLKDSMAKAGFDMEKVKKEGANLGKLKPIDSSGEEAKAWKTVWSAGQGVSNIHDCPAVADLATRLKTEYTDAKKDLAAKLGLAPPPVKAKPAAPKP
ncbi:MAG: NAD(P)H-dependent flavin oxidoreductase [Alphaproteobacteria bacterium]